MPTAKRHLSTDPRIQVELNIALREHARHGNVKGVLLSLWAGADPVARALIADLGRRHPTYTRAQLRRAFRREYAAITADLEGAPDDGGSFVVG